MSETLLEDAMPNGCHPALAEIADLTRPSIGRMSAIRYVIPSTTTARWFTDGADDPTDTEIAREGILTVRRCAAQAPWAYMPFVYGWYAATDHLGRSIGGSDVTIHADESRRLIEGFPSWGEIVAALPTYDEYSR